MKGQESSDSNRRLKKSDSKTAKESGSYENLCKLFDEIDAIRFDSAEDAVRTKKILRIKKELRNGQYNQNTLDVARAVIEELYSS